MDRRKFFSFLPAAPVGMLMAAEAMAKAPPASMAPDKALMTLTAHSTPPLVTPRDPFTFAPLLERGSFTIPKEYVNHYVSSLDNKFNNKLTIGKGMEVEACLLYTSPSPRDS